LIFWKYSRLLLRDHFVFVFLAIHRSQVGIIQLCSDLIGCFSLIS
jgi:hypothetical protein